MTRSLATSSLVFLSALCIATPLLWARSFATADWIAWQWTSFPQLPYAHRQISLLSARGTLTLRFERVIGVNPNDQDNEQWLRNLHERFQFYHAPADAAYVDTEAGEIDDSIGSAPQITVNFVAHSIQFFWISACIYAACGASIYVRFRPHVRSRAGLCPSCSYDLRASKDRCPECGTQIPAPPTI